MRFSATPQEQLQILTTGVVDLVTRDELLSRLEKAYQTGKPLVVKLGADPSAPDIHLGHTVVLQKMRQFQALGHEVVFLIGDFTGRVGDPTGKKKTRPALSEEEVLANAETYKAQIGKILDLERTRIEFNSRWLAPLNFADVLKLTAQYTVARMLERDDFATRYKNQVPISIVEFLYPLMQGYDSVALHADVELGGVDQTFNLLVGRDLQKAYGQAPQVIMTMPILEGLDGKEKMSKSLGNYVGINEPPDQIYGKLMSIPDELMGKYFELLTDLTPTQLAEVKERASREPKAVKMLLARRITAMYHGEVAAAQAEAGFEKLFGKTGDGLPEDLEEARVVAPPEGLTLIRLLTMTGLAPSGGEAKRLLQQGGVRVDQVKQADPQRLFHKGETFILQAGKRGFRRVVLE
ncbi:MAG: Tyrosyl-tRNA synthetase [Candidatus Ozemobacter sibiricus]|uniref:Tyrosine--tRNA ligase n=1 Tax=Candidatus Ozemobacter sibiricus TaxID=2268124 RepID=A0A367ZUC5_9BACT|nr:MAG: Tyrosyl-tRNA synthetase [Candidatus Ozemobacter sibiricus]